MMRKGKNVLLRINRRAAVRYLFVALCILISVYVACLITVSCLAKQASLFSISSVTVHCDQWYSDIRKQELVAFVEQSVANANFLFFNKSHFYISLQKEFTNIEKIYIQRSLSKGLIVRIVGIRPAYCINDSHVLGCDGKLYAREWYATWQPLYCERLFVDDIAMFTQVQRTLISFLQTIPQAIFRHYTVRCCAIDRVELIAQSQEIRHSIVLACVADQLSKLSRIPFILHDIVNRAAIFARKKNRKYVVLDVRFDKRIIVKILDVCKGRGG